MSWWLNSSGYNASWDEGGEESREEYIFHRNDVFYIFLAAYLLVAVLAVCGNFLVILVVQCDRQVESKTNFLLGQLALADLCVGVFCVMQSFMAYLSNWLLGLFMCQMYLYVQALSYVASVLIMVAVCVERYVAIMQPFHTRSVLTTARLRLIVVVVWVVSAAYAAPRLFFARVTSQPLRHSTEHDTFCHLDTRRYDPDAFDMANLVLLYALPLFAMFAMYSRMCVELWRSGMRVPAGNVHAGRTLSSGPNANTTATANTIDDSPPGNTTTTSLLALPSEHGYEAQSTLQTCASCGADTRSLRSNVGVRSPSPVPNYSPPLQPLRRLKSLPPCRVSRDPLRPSNSPRPRKRKRSWCKLCRERRNSNTSIAPPASPQPPPTPEDLQRRRRIEAVPATLAPPRRVENVPGPLAARRRVVLMLMLVVLSFLLCNLPYHARKMWQARLRSQPSLAPPTMSFYSKLFTPATFLVMYLNSALNPVLYVTMSRSFRRAMFRRLRVCSRGLTSPLRLCPCLCKKEPLPSPLIGRNASMCLAASSSSSRACSVAIQPSSNGHHGMKPETGVQPSLLRHNGGLNLSATGV